MQENFNGLEFHITLAHSLLLTTFFGGTFLENPKVLNPIQGVKQTSLKMWEEIEDWATLEEEAIGAEPQCFAKLGLRWSFPQLPTEFLSVFLYFIFWLCISVNLSFGSNHQD